MDAKAFCDIMCIILALLTNFFDTEVKEKTMSHFLPTPLTLLSNLATEPIDHQSCIRLSPQKTPPRPSPWIDARQGIQRRIEPL